MAGLVLVFALVGSACGSHRRGTDAAAEIPVAPNAPATSPLISRLRLGAPGSGSPTTTDPTDSTAAADQSTTPTTEKLLEGGPWLVGQCLKWNPAESDTFAEVVSCTSPHYFEVTGSETYDGPQDTYPSDAQWHAWAASGPCAADAAAFLAHPIDPHGEFGPTSIHPTSPGWAAGERGVTCGLELDYDTDGHPRATTGTFRGQDAGLDDPPGTCYAATLDGKDIVASSCFGTHIYEVVGAIDLAGKYEQTPSQAQWANIKVAQCQPLALTYLGRPLNAGSESVTVAPIEADSWAAGTRKTDCLMDQIDPKTNQTVPRSRPIKP